MMNFRCVSYLFFGMMDFCCVFYSLLRVLNLPSAATQIFLVVIFLLVFIIRFVVDVRLFFIFVLVVVVILSQNMPGRIRQQGDCNG